MSEVIEVHKAGNLESAFSRRRQPKPQIKYKCSERIEEVVKALKSNRLVRKGLLNDNWHDLVYAPVKTVKIRRDMTTTNAQNEKRLAKVKVLEQASKTIGEKTGGSHEECGEPKMKEAAGQAKGAKTSSGGKKGKKEAKSSSPSVMPQSPSAAAANASTQVAVVTHSTKRKTGKVDQAAPAPASKRTSARLARMELTKDVSK